MITIAIDAMSGDFGPGITVPASVRALSFIPDINLLLLGDSQVIQSELAKLDCNDDMRLRIVHTTQTVAMDDKPLQVLRNRKDSSLYRGIALLAESEVQAFVSAGNTGAMLVIGHHLLQRFEGIDRPAICAPIPTVKGQTFLLDVGANIDVNAENLHQFAVMGSVLASAILDIPEPRVALLNVGVEDIKGNEQVQRAAALLQADSALHYTGFIEADQIFFDTVDVAVCDGFVGNVALKASEGAARLIRQYLSQAFKRKSIFRVLGVLVAPILKAFRSSINPSRYNGASFLGFTSTLVKSHGSADINAFFHAIEVASIEAKEDIPGKIGEKLQDLLLKRGNKI
jgi:glycerol-3-phosphate acyltransferase PlsX